MKTHNDNSPDEEGREERDNTAFDFWSDEGARRFNEALDEGSAYARAHGHVTNDPESYFEEGTVNTTIQSCVTPTNKPSLQETWS